jgi:TolB protein
MKLILATLVVLFQFQAFAQDAVIAVGKAEADKDKLVIDDAEMRSLSGSQSTVAKDVIETLRNDFTFYKHKFNNIDYSEKGKNSFSNPQVEAWAGAGLSYFVATQMTGSGSGVSANFKVWSVSTKKMIFNQSFTIAANSVRPSVHKAADQIYRSMTGRPSVFNSKIVFVSDRTSRTKDVEKELYIMDFDGRRVEKLTSFNSIVISPSISPDNTRVMFSLIANHRDMTRKKVRNIKNIDLKMYNLVTKQLTTISDRPGINSGAIFSHQGEQIYLTLTNSGNAEIYSMNTNGSNLRKVTNSHADDVDPSITRDGSLMTFLSNRAGRAHIYTMNPSGQEQDVKRISFVGQFNATPKFSPEGKEIVFSSWVDNGFDLYRIDATGANLSRLTKDFGSNEEPMFSPDGEFIIFTSKRILSRTKAVQDIYIMNREGEILGQLTQDFGRCFSPQWTNLPN